MSTGRLERVRALLTERNLDALLISNPFSRRYVTGYTSEDHAPNESSGVALVTADSATLFTSKNNTGWAAAEAPDFEIVGWENPWNVFVGEAIASAGMSRIGFEDEALTVADYQALTGAAGGDWEPLGNAIEALRVIKDDQEIALIAKAASITDQALASALSRLEPGDTELDLRASLENAMRALGATGLGFHTIVASGPNAARPHHSPEARPIVKGEPIIIDMGAEVDGYTADLTRTVCLGEPTPELAKVYTIVLDAHRAALATVRAGVTGKEVDAAARDVIAAAGYGDQFVHSLGHGVGLRIHEAPSASQTSDQVLEAGMTLTIEPGIYIPGWGGVRIENLVVVEENGCRDLTSSPTRLAIDEAIAGV